MKKGRLAIVAFLTELMITSSNYHTCSRAVYFGKAGQTVTGRTMDWFISDILAAPHGTLLTPDRSADQTRQ